VGIRYKLIFYRIQRNLNFNPDLGSCNTGGVAFGLNIIKESYRIIPNDRSEFS
jgi:hypothetical protein